MIPNALVMSQEGRRKLNEETYNARRNTIIKSSRIKCSEERRTAKKKATGNTN